MDSDPAQRDVLLKLGSLSQGYSALQDLSNTIQFKQLLKHNTSTLVNELNKCLLEMCCEAEDLLDTEWPGDLIKVLFRSSSFTLRLDELLEQINKESDESAQRLKRNLKIKVINIVWMFTDKKNFLQFA